jgi:DNA-binding transcriptional ArsR family regulator
MRGADAVFRPLSDPVRRRLLDRLNERNGLTLTELYADMVMTRQSVSKHLDVLEEAWAARPCPSEWTMGSTWDLVHEDVGLVVSDPEQVILEADPPPSLLHVAFLTLEWAALAGLDEETASAWRAEHRSRWRTTSKGRARAWSG